MGLEFGQAKDFVARVSHVIRDRLSPRKKYILEVSNEVDALMAGIAFRKAIKRGNVIENAVATYAYLQKELHPANGGERHLVIRDRNKILRRVELP